MAIQPSQPQGIGGVLDTAFQLYKSSLAVVWPISLLLAIVGAPPTLYSIFSRPEVAQPASVDELLNMVLGPSDPMATAIAWISGLLSLWVMSALYLKQRAAGMDAEMSVGAALKVAARRLGPMVLATFLALLAVVIGIALLLVPGLILLVTLMMYMLLLLFEDKSAVESLTASHNLVWGNWWRSSAILTVALILVLVIFAAIGFVAVIAAPFADLAVGDIVVAAMIGELVFNLAFNVLLMPFFTAVMIALYWDLKLRKEGGDLAARVNALNAA
ncbi:hypothetical protein [Steroidobacter sp.]|uniref:hypothetical protein n=1 Tax=Steroidobacter sp. TaxID=1978227 RepID=UPI001A49B64F|nr:hypothetical protein [Steroidobacter sp.]MBL8266220.1 hypothetical protein [Steroidobacter sp.]